MLNYLVYENFNLLVIFCTIFLLLVREFIEVKKIIFDFFTFLFADGATYSKLINDWYQTIRIDESFPKMYTFVGPGAWSWNNHSIYYRGWTGWDKKK